VGLILHNVEGGTLSVLGFDIRQGSLCTLKRTAVHRGHSRRCGAHSRGLQLRERAPSAAKGWERFRFDPARAVPAIAPDSIVKSITLTLEDGPDVDGGMVVLDNINVNGNVVGHE
jgi:hypothetical protein